MLSDAEKAREFTKDAGFPVPVIPEVMTKDEVFFLVKMMLDEIMELCATVEEPTEVKQKLVDLITDSKNIPKSIFNSDHEQIAEQVDALVDCYYYSLNSTVKKGINFSKVFNIVHDANMAKRDPVSGLFFKRDDGKIMKPPMWKEPDIKSEILKQINEHSFKD